MKRRRPGEALVEDAGEGVDVGARVDRFPLDLLRSAVLDRADEAAGARGQFLDDTEVGEVGAVVVGNEDVRGLHVAVDEPPCVRGLERGADLPDDPERAPGRQPPLSREQALQIVPLDAGHRDVQEPVLLARVVDRDDARVVERRRELRLAQKALAEVGLPQPRREQLQRRRAPEPDVLGTVDDARAAAPERLDDAVAAEHRADPPIKRHRHDF